MTPLASPHQAGGKQRDILVLLGLQQQMQIPSGSIED